MDKEYTKDINNFNELEKALNDWFNVFKWYIEIINQNLTSLDTLSKFNYSVEWDFLCNQNKLTSLIGCPTRVWWEFFCNNNKLTTLEWCPEIIWENFDCTNNQLTSLEYSPKSLGWIFLWYDNNFIPLEKNQNNIFKLWDSIYIWSVKTNTKDIQNLTNVDINAIRSPYYNNIKNEELSQQYYNSYISFINSTTKLNNSDITDTDITFNWKKFKKKLFNKSLGLNL